MHNSTILLVTNDEDQETPEYQEDLRARGFVVNTAPFPAEHPADAILVDLLSRSARAARDALMQQAHTLSHCMGDRKVPVVALCEPDFSDDLSGESEIDDVLHPPLTGAQIAARLSTLGRLNTMHHELARRLQTYASYGLDAPDIAPTQSAQDASVLVVGDGWRLALIQQAMAHTASITGAFTCEAAEDYLQKRAFDQLILDMEAEAASDFVTALRRNPRHFSLPILVLMKEQETDYRDRLFEEGACDVFVDPVDIADLAIKSSGFIKEYRFREKLRSVYRQARHMATGDALTGLFSRGFALQHLTRLLEEIAGSGERLSVAGLTIGNLHRINEAHGFAAGDRIIRQIGTLVGQLVRGEDMVARWKGGSFVVLLTGTDLEAAEPAIRRIRSVINHTMFSVEDIATPIEVQVEMHVVAAAAGDRPEGLARKALGMPETG